LYSGGLDRQYVLAETVYDAQIGYDFQDDSSLHGLSLFLQGQNLTDERSATIGTPALPGSWLKYQKYGRRFLAGATYKFGGTHAAPPPPPPAPLPPPPPATQTCADGSVVAATAACPVPPPPPPPPAAAPERGS
jgi:iron complex outermembrane receptor protein